MTEEKKWELKDYKSDLKPIWCPGCGDFGVLNSLYKALTALQLDPKDTAVISGIGCSSRLPGYLNTYGFNSIHGRAIPIASGVKLGNPDIEVIAVGGDGDGFSIGGGHIAHAARRNINMTYIVMDNQIYGLTKGQLSPTSELRLKTKTSKYGSIDTPVNPVSLCLAYGVSFIARTYSGNPKHMVEMITQGIKHEGFSFIHCLSPCVTFRGKEQYDYFNDNTELVPKQHDPANKGQALAIGESMTPMYLGAIYHNHFTTYEDRLADFREKHKKTDGKKLLDKYRIQKYDEK